MFIGKRAMLFTLLISLNITFSFQNQLRSNKPGHHNGHNGSKRNKEMGMDTFAEDLKLVKQALKSYVYYYALLAQNEFTSPIQKMNTQANFASAQSKIQTFLTKHRQNKFIMNQVIHEYNKIVSKVGQHMANVHTTADVERKPFMWG